MVKILIGADEALTLSGVIKKDGRKPLEKDLGIIKKPILVKDQKQILFCGPKAQFNKFFSQNKELFKNKKYVKDINIDGGSILPGFVESHTHSVFAGNRQNDFELRNKGMSYQEIAERGGGIAYTVKQTGKASELDLLKLTLDRCEVFAKQGVVLLESKSGYGLDHKNELKALRVLQKLSNKNLKVVSTYLGLHSIPKGIEKRTYIKECLEKTLPYLVKNKMCSRADIFVEDKYYTPEDLEYLVTEIKKHGWNFCAHTEQLTHSGGTARAVGLGAQSVEHCVQVNDRDIDLLAKSKTVANLLPAADFYLKMKYPPARKMIDLGVKVALATDFNPGTSPTQSLNFVGVLARLEMQMTRAEVITAYTYNAASALGCETQYGALLPGYNPQVLIFNQDWRNIFYQVGEELKPTVL